MGCDDDYSEEDIRVSRYLDAVERCQPRDQGPIIEMLLTESEHVLQRVGRMALRTLPGHWRIKVLDNERLKVEVAGVRRLPMVDQPWMQRMIDEADLLPRDPVCQTPEGLTRFPVVDPRG